MALVLAAVEGTDSACGMNMPGFDRGVKVEGYKFLGTAWFGIIQLKGNTIWWGWRCIALDTLI